MNKEDIIKHITDILDDSKIGVLSTSLNDIPNARYMWFYNDGLTLIAKTNDQSHKFEELQHNPHVHILLGFDDTKNHAFVEYQGTAKLIHDKEQVREIWEPEDDDFFDNPDNPDIAILKITPTHIKIMNDKFEGKEISLD